MEEIYKNNISEDEARGEILRFVEDYCSSSFDVLPNGIEVLNKRRMLMEDFWHYFIDDAFVVPVTVYYIETYLKQGLGMAEFKPKLINIMYSYLASEIAPAVDEVKVAIEKYEADAKRAKEAMQRIQAVFEQNMKKHKENKNK